MHIKFLAHGKGSATHASAYLLDDLDHKGQVRAGIEVLRGDATTFNSICNSSRHLWKYTSGIIAWSKDDAPTNEQIHEVLTEFEAHAFAGLDPSQYHLFAVQHTDDDGSKHIHVLVPRLDLASGKSLNIAPPGHEAHFDALRDYFNTKYDWSRPDDISLSNLTQEPNYVIKLNKHAEKIIPKQDLGKLKKKQFYKFIDMQIRELLKKGEIQNRSDIIAEIEHLNGVKSVKAGKDYISVKIDNEKETTHRLKGDFYHEDFEIGAYAERLREAEGSRPTEYELAAAIKDAERLLDSHRAKRAAYHAKHHAFAQRTPDDRSRRTASTLDFDRDRESITPNNTNAHNELYGANTSIKSTAIEYRYIEHQNRHNQHRFVFNINPGVTEAHQQPSPKPQDRSKELTEQYPSPSPTSTSKPKRADRKQHTNPAQRKIEYPESNPYLMGNDGFWSADSFNEFLTQLSSKFKFKNDHSTTRSDSTELTNNFKSKQQHVLITEENYADRNRPFFERAKRLIESTNQLVNRAKQSIESTSEFIKKHLEQIQRSRAELTKQNQQLEKRERNPAGLNFSTETGAFKARTGQLIGAVTASISKQCADPITDAINTSFEAAGFKQHCQQLSKHSIETHSIEYQLTASRPRERTLENLATESTRQLLRRFRDAEQANRHARGDSRKINRINQQLGQLEKIAAEIRLMPKPATDFQFSSLRNDNYYPDCVLYHKELCDKQQQAYDSKKLSLLIDYTKKKAENLETYMSRASRKLNKSDYNKIEQIIQNDQRMLKYRQCEKILEPQNSHFEQQRETYQTCLKHFENIKSDIEQIKNPSSQHNVSQNSYEPEYKAKPQNDLDFNF